MPPNEPLLNGTIANLKMENSFYRGTIECLQCSAPGNGNLVMLLEVHNQSANCWSSYGDSVVNLGYHWFVEDGTLVDFEGVRTCLPDVGIHQGDSGIISVQVELPIKPGAYELLLTLVREDVSWFEAFEEFQPLRVRTIISAN